MTLGARALQPNGFRFCFIPRKLPSIVLDDKPGGKDFTHFQFIGPTQAVIQKVIDYVRRIVVDF